MKYIIEPAHNKEAMSAWIGPFDTYEEATAFAETNKDICGVVAPIVPVLAWQLIAKCDALAKIAFDNPDLPKTVFDSINTEWHALHEQAMDLLADPDGNAETAMEWIATNSKYAPPD